MFFTNLRKLPVVSSIDDFKLLPRAPKGHINGLFDGFKHEPIYSFTKRKGFAEAPP